MTLSRREFVAGSAGCACGLASGCIGINPVPMFEAGADHTLPLPKELAGAGSQVKVRLSGSDALILV